MNPEIQNALQRIAESQTRMREQLIEFSNINSGSFHVAGVNRFGAAMQELLAPLAASSELIALDDFQATANDGSALRKPIGKALRLRQRPDAPRGARERDAGGLLSYGGVLQVRVRGASPALDRPQASGRGRAAGPCGVVQCVVVHEVLRGAASERPVLLPC